MLRTKVGESLDGVLKMDFLVPCTNDAFWSLIYNKRKNNNFTLLCLWNLQIQFQFWYMLYFFGRFKNLIFLYMMGGKKATHNEQK